MVKGQMKIQQTAFLLIALTLFFVLVGIFVLGFGLSGLKKDVTQLNEKNAILLAKRLANSPEFSCGNAFGNGLIYCVDEDKIMMLKNNQDKYKNFWGASNIEIRVVYPEYGREIECKIPETYPTCNVIKIIPKDRSGTADGPFVSLCRKEVIDGNIYTKCSLAKLLVSYEDVK